MLLRHSDQPAASTLHLASDNFEPFSYRVVVIRLSE